MTDYDTEHQEEAITIALCNPVRGKDETTGPVRCKDETTGVQVYMLEC